jgi:hypothetical protein
MDQPKLFLRRMAGIACVLLAVSSALVILPARRAAAAHGDCRLSVSGPFFYAGMVFPVIEVTCDSVKQTIRIDAALDMDGSEVATSGRTCRRASSCVTGLASDGIFAHDIPEDQRWCGRGSASIRAKGEQTHLGPEAGSCESESF